MIEISFSATFYHFHLHSQMVGRKVKGEGVRCLSVQEGADNFNDDFARLWEVRRRNPGSSLREEAGNPGTSGSSGSSKSIENKERNRKIDGNRCFFLEEDLDLQILINTQKKFLAPVAFDEPKIFLSLSSSCTMSKPSAARR